MYTPEHCMETDDQKQVRPEEAPATIGQAAGQESALLQQGELEQEAGQRQARRKHRHRLWVLGVWAVAVGVLAICFAALWHLVMPACWQFLTERDELVVTTAAVSLVISPAATWMVRKAFEE